MERAATVLIIGDSGLAETQPVARRVCELVGEHNVRHVANVAEARSLTASVGWYPDLVVVLQTWSDQFSPREVLDLVKLAPLARVVCAYGPWCESDGRTRAIWPLAVRAPAADAMGRIRNELQLIRGTASESVPMTASRAEVFEATCRLPLRLSATAAPIGVQSRDAPFRRMLTDALHRSDYRVVDPGDAAILVWDADPPTAGRAAQLRRLHVELPRAAIVACTGFPGDDLSGATEFLEAVWPKLSPFESLLDRLDELAATNRFSG